MLHMAIWAVYDTSDNSIQSSFLAILFPSDSWYMGRVIITHGHLSMTFMLIVLPKRRSWSQMTYCISKWDSGSSRAMKLDRNVLNYPLQDKYSFSGSCCNSEHRIHASGLSNVCASVWYLCMLLWKSIKHKLSIMLSVKEKHVFALPTPF